MSVAIQTRSGNLFPTLGDENRLSKKERRVDALALRAYERRDKLRKAAGSCK